MLVKVSKELELDFSHVRISLDNIADELGSRVACTPSEMPFVKVLLDNGIERALTTAEKLNAYKETISDIVVIGIGGSSLGIQMLVNALLGEFHNYRAEKRIFFLENVDPDTVNDIFELLNLKSTVFCVISKSGTTLETITLMNLAIDRLRAQGLKLNEHMIFITDPGSKLEALAKQLNAPHFPIIKDIGGRYSVLTNVGLVPSVLLGIDFIQVLEGALDVWQLFNGKPICEHPGVLLGYAKAKHYTMGRMISVLMPYSDRLRKFANWYVQLWAESLGKALDRDGKKVNCGPTPLPAVGTVDQHSLLQLFREGKDDKVYQLVRVEKYSAENKADKALTIQSNYILDYVGDKRLADVMHAEFTGTLEALKDAQRPIITLTLQTISPRTMGQLILLYEIATYTAGTYLNVNPYDQPGVEFGKRVARQILSS